MIGGLGWGMLSKKRASEAPAWAGGRSAFPLLRPSHGRGTADWFGVSKDSDSTQKWQRKSIRHCSQRYGKLKPQVIRELDLPSQDNVSLTSTETPPPLYVGPCQLGMQKVCPFPAASSQLLTLLPWPGLGPQPPWTEEIPRSSWCGRVVRWPHKGT